jgi:hypothetical protein
MHHLFLAGDDPSLLIFSPTLSNHFERVADRIAVHRSTKAVGNSGCQYEDWLRSRWLTIKDRSWDEGRLSTTAPSLSNRALTFAVLTGAGRNPFCVMGRPRSGQ